MSRVITGYWCAYHPQNVANLICERCRRPICFSDRKVYTKWKGHGHHRIRETREYCVFCHAAVLQHDASLEVLFPQFLVYGLIGLFVSIFFPPMLLIMIGIGIFSYLNAKQKANSAASEAALFYRSISSSTQIVSGSSTTRMISLQTRPAAASPTPIPTTSTRPNELTSELDTSGNQFVLVCFECGEKLLLSDKFCPNCGDSTQEELQAYYKEQQKSTQ